MALFDKLKRIIIPASEETAKPQQPEKPSQSAPAESVVEAPADTDNAFDRSREIIGRIITVLRPLAGAGGSRDLTIWVNEPTGMLAQLISSDSFRGNLASDLIEARLEQFARGNIYIEESPLPEGQKSFTIYPEKLYISIIKPVVGAPRMRRATLELIEGKALQPVMELNPEQSRHYAIGRCRMQRSNNRMRINDYVVNDNEPDAPTGCVSHAHCDIYYRDGSFYLQACPGGCRLEGGSPTKIISHVDGKFMELDSSSIQRPLHPGDIIELGKKVLIRFRE